MTVAVRSSATVTNGTAGTSVTVAKPSGTADGDLLVAFIAELGTGAITKPSASWELIGTVSGGTGVTLGAYWKVASSEGATWTWTLGASVRNWGAVHAITGADTSEPIASSASDGDTGGGFSGLGNDPVDNLPPHGYLLTAIAAALAASGSPITWTGVEQTEWDADVAALADVSTNAGAGNDITGTVRGFAAPERAVANSGWMFAASASATLADGAAWAVAINPSAAGTAYDGGELRGSNAALVEAAFGADPNSDPDGWVWTPISVREQEGIRITKGRQDWAAVASPTELQFAVNNLTGDWTPENPVGANYPNIVEDLPIRVTLPFGHAGQSRRVTAFVSSYRPSWDATTRWSIMKITASGRLRRANKGQRLLASPLYYAMAGQAEGDSLPYAYWSCEDGPNATQPASAIAGVRPGKSSGSVSFAAESDLAASAPLPLVASGASLTFVVPPYTDTQQWVVQFVAKVPSEPGAETTIAEFRSSGSARRFVYTIAPGSPSELRLKKYDASGALISTGTDPLDGVSNAQITEAEFYGHWVLHTIALADDGFGGGPTGYSGQTITDSFAGIGGTSAGSTYGILQQIRLFGGNGIAYGHVVVFTDPAFDIVTGSDANARAFRGHIGEITISRFGRLCTQRVIDYDFARQAYTRQEADYIPMGAQPSATFSTNLQEIERTEQGLIHDGGPNGELLLDVRRDRYNAQVALTVDMALGQLALGFAPVHDDQRLVDDVIVTNRDGSSYRFATSDSGEHTGTLQVNVSPERWLAHLAGWAVNQGTVHGWRYPKLSINLRRSPELAAAWLDCQPGSRIQAVNLPSQHPSTTDADVILEGYTETIFTDRWTVDMVVSPYRPYEVFTVEDQTLGRLDTAGTVLVDAVTTSGTSLKFATTRGPLWINSTDRPQDFPFDVAIADQRNTITAIAKPAVTFVAAGTASTGSSGSRTPGIPAGVATGDLVLIFASTRNSGTGVPATPANWHRYTVFDAASNVQLFGRIYDGVWSMPTVTYTSGAANEDTIAQSCALRGSFYSASGLVVASASCLNPTAQDITAAPLALTKIPNEFAALYLGWKADDWTSVAQPGSWTEIQEATSTAGNDAGQVWGYRLFTSKPAAGTLAPALAVTGGATAISRGAVLAIRPDYQTATATRGVDGVVKALAAGDAVSLWKPAVLAL